MRDGYFARWRGVEYEASPDGDRMRLYSSDQNAGFEQIAPGRFQRIVPAAELEDFAYIRTVCRWRGELFQVIGGQDAWLRIEYAGTDSAAAQAMGLEEFDRGVYQGWARREDVEDLQESRV